MKTRSTVPLIVLILLTIAAIATACSVPVFRYALERWDASEYQLTYFYRSPLTDADKAALAQLEKKIDDSRAKGLNLQLKKVDLAGEVEQPFKDLFAAQKDAKLPIAVLTYPPKGLFPTVLARPDQPPAPMFETLWSGTLTPDLTDKLIDSPARTDIADKIQKGESAVWILLESGDKKKDDATAKLLRAELDKATKELQLPEIDPEDPAWSAGGTPLAEVKKKLKLSFALKRISRTDPAEQFFIRMLLQSEPGLADDKYAKEPMAFAIFGQGRLYKALVGKGIAPDEIRSDCAFLIGECSCTIKEQNPGRDLLIKTNWLEGIGQSAIQTIQLPPLQGLPEIQPKTTQPGQLTPTTPPPPQGTLPPPQLTQPKSTN